MKPLKTWLGGLSTVGKLGVAAVTVGTVGVIGVAAASPCIEAPLTTNRDETMAVAFATTDLKDGSQAQGSSKIKTPGVNGEKKTTYRVTTKCKKEVSKTSLREEVTKNPVTEEVLVGNKHNTTETQVIPYGHKEVSDNSLGGGQKKLQTAGSNGTKTLTYEISQDEGQPENKVLAKEDVTAPATDEVYGVGPQCDPNYTGACVPNVPGSDVDCGSGRGNGPYYVYGTVRVVGVDRYGLDGNHDGYGCE